MDKVSVIIPVYNGSSYIEKCINSVLAQTYENIEIIAINDGSKDDSLKILQKLAKQDIRLKVIDQENMGVAKTRNKGIKMATGKYIAFVDNDDFLDVDYIYEYVNSAKENDADVVLGGFKRIDSETGKVLYKEKLKNTYYSRYIIVTPWARLLKRKFLIDNKIEYFSYGIGEDVYFNLVLYDKNPTLNIIDYIGYNQLYNKQSVSNTKQKGLNNSIDCTVLLNEIKKYYGEREDIYINFFYHKYIIWYLLFSGRYASSDKFINEYKRLIKWEKNNVKGKIISPFSTRTRGEYVKTKLIILIFNIICRLRLIKFFSKIYCKGA